MISILRLREVPSIGRYYWGLFIEPLIYTFLQLMFSTCSSMGKRLNDKNLFHGPSPHEYAPKTDTFSAPGKTIGIRLDEKQLEKKLIGPGPGAYDNPGMKNHNYSFSMGLKVKDLENTEKFTPGPGAYNNDISSKLTISNS